MRLYLSSVAIIALFACPSYGFSTPNSVTSKTATTQLNSVGTNLADMLNDYNSGSSSSSASTAVTKTVTKVAETVVTSTPPVSSPPVEISESAVDSVIKAATASQDAANEAAAAAAAVSSKMAAATKTAAVTKAAVVGSSAAASLGGINIKVPDGSGYYERSKEVATNLKLPDISNSMGDLKIPGLVQVDPSKIDPNYRSEASLRAQENLATLKANLGIVGDGRTAFPGAGSGLKEGISGVALPSVPSMDVHLPALQPLIDSLHLKEYAGWYAAVALAIVASQQRTAGKKEAGAEFESELTKAQMKANEAASAAGLAAEGANTAKKLAMKMEKDLKKDGGKALLDDSLAKKAAMEKDIMEKEMRSLQAEVLSLKKQLELAQGGTKKKASSTKKQTIKTEIEQEYPKRVTLESDPDENARVIELLKEMDSENASKKKATRKALEKKREEESKFVASEKAKAVSKKMTKGVEVAQAKAEVAVKKRKAATKKAKSATATSKSPAKKKAAVAKKTAAASSSDDWATLAESTLKRKTVAQLTDYLSGKGVTTVSGKKKAELLDMVKSL